MSINILKKILFFKIFSTIFDCKMFNSSSIEVLSRKSITENGSQLYRRSTGRLINLTTISVFTLFAKTFDEHCSTTKS